MPASSNRVRVVYLTHTLGVGGAEELILNMVTRLPRDRFEPIVCCFENPPGPMGTEIANQGIRVVPLGIMPGWRRPFDWWTIVSASAAPRAEDRSCLSAAGEPLRTVGGVRPHACRSSSARK